jgi:Septation protein etd1
VPKECWDGDFEEEGEDMWMIPEKITDAQDKLKGYLANIRTFSSLIEDLKRFRQIHPRTLRQSLPQEELLDEIDAMIEISTLDGFTPPPFSGPPLSPKKSTPSIASSQWSFEERFASFGVEDDRISIPSPPSIPESTSFDPQDSHARRLLEKILGESNDLRMEVRPEQLTKMIDYVANLRERCDEFDESNGAKGPWNIGLGVYV